MGTQEEVTNFEVKILVLDDIIKVRPGMSATVDIITNVKDNALKLPIQSVTVRQKKEIEGWLAEKDSKGTNDDDSAGSYADNGEDDLEEIVFVIENEMAKARVVKTGISSDTHIEIFSGVEEGETVVTGSYRVLSKDLRHDAKVKIDKKSRRFQSKSN